MARLIDADKTMDKLRAYADRKCANGYMNTANGILSAVNYIKNNATRVDAVEVVHGRWIQDKKSKFEHRYNCSACNYRLIDEHCNYCPNCGAKMDL